MDVIYIWIAIITTVIICCCIPAFIASEKDSKKKREFAAQVARYMENREVLPNNNPPQGVPPQMDDGYHSLETLV